MAQRQKRMATSMGCSQTNERVARSRANTLSPLPTLSRESHMQRCGPAANSFMSTLVMNNELFFYQVVPLLQAYDLKTLCDALHVSRAGLTILTDSSQWQNTAEREGLVGSVAVTRTMRCSRGCRELCDYLSRRAQLESFDTNVVVMAGDLEKIQQVDDVPVDCLIFPTSSSFQDPVVGSAGCVHRRMGLGLRKHLASILPTISLHQPGPVLATPGFAGNIRLLVHCVGPRGTDPGRQEELYSTYIKALGKFEDAITLKCAAIASISTGLLEYPVVEAAEVAMAAVCDILRTRSWPLEKKIAFICIDSVVLNAFSDARTAARQAFFSSAMFPRDV